MPLKTYTPEEVAKLGCTPKPLSGYLVAAWHYSGYWSIRGESGARGHLTPFKSQAAAEEHAKFMHLTWIEKRILKLGE